MVSIDLDGTEDLPDKKIARIESNGAREQEENQRNDRHVPKIKHRRHLDAITQTGCGRLECSAPLGRPNNKSRGEKEKKKTQSAQEVEAMRKHACGDSTLTNFVISNFVKK